MVTRAQSQCASGRDGTRRTPPRARHTLTGTGRAHNTPRLSLQAYPAAGPSKRRGVSVKPSARQAAFFLQAARRAAAWLTAPHPAAAAASPTAAALGMPDSRRRVAARTGMLFAHLGPHALLVQLLVFLASGALGALNRKEDRSCGETQSSDERGAERDDGKLPTSHMALERREKCRRAPHARRRARQGPALRARPPPPVPKSREAAVEYRCTHLPRWPTLRRPRRRPRLR